MKEVVSEGYPPPDLDVIATLKDWLEMAESGELRTLFACGKLAGPASMVRAWNGHWNATETLGTIEFAKFHIMEAQKE